MNAPFPLPNVLDGAALLVLAPHPDDEVIGCGGSIAKFKEMGARVYVNFLTIGNSIEWSEVGHSTAEQRTLELKRVATRLGFDDFHVSFRGDDYHLLLDLIPQRDMITAIDIENEVALQQVRPDIVMIPAADSYNQDHRAVARAALAALRPSDARHYQAPVVLAYEQLADRWNASVAGEPNVFVELEARHLRSKLEAMALYESQCREHPHPRSIASLEHLAAVRGAQCGAHYAEAFSCLRWRV